MLTCKPEKSFFSLSVTEVDGTALVVLPPRLVKRVTFVPAPDLIALHETFAFFRGADTVLLVCREHLRTCTLGVACLSSVIFSIFF